jgi:hypothetical protein
MILPINFDELSVLLATMAIILLVTPELMNFYSRKLLINKRRLRAAGIIFSVFFLTTVIVRVVNIILSSL